MPREIENHRQSSSGQDAGARFCIKDNFLEISNSNPRIAVPAITVLVRGLWITSTDIEGCVSLNMG